MTKACFDPRRLRPEATLNGTRLADVPGGDPALVGRLAAEVVSSQALRESSIAAYRQGLAQLIGTLRLGPTGGESEWRAAYLRYWQGVRHIWLGGGIAAAYGAELSMDTVQVAEHAAILPLIGCARTLPAPDSRRAVLDFGQTSVKRGIAHYERGALRELQVMSSVAAPAEGAENIVEFVLQTVRAMADGEVVASVAAYVAGGKPVDKRGTYAPLANATLPRRLRFVHDGTAAAAAIDSSERAAVIMLGTYLGVGFVPQGNAARVPLADGFGVQEA
jgi:hypothetical protein